MLDIDILLFGGQVLPDCNVPRDEIEKFAYILKPLSELYPDLTHPRCGRRFAEIWAQFAAADQPITTVAVDLSPAPASG